MGTWQYKRPSQDAMKRKAESAGSRFRGKGYLQSDLYKAYVPRDGQNKLRIVPPLEVDVLEWYGLDVGLHRNVGLQKDMYLCLRYMSLGECPICELQTKELWDEDPNLAKTYYPEKRCLVWVVDLLSENAMKELMLWSVAQGTLSDIHNVTVDPETGKMIDLMDPRDGVAVFFKKSGKGIKTEYDSILLGKTAVPLPDAILNQRKPVADLLIVPTYEEVKAATDFTGKSTWAGTDTPAGTPPAASAPPSEAEVEVEEEAGGCVLDGMSRDELKAFKVQYKADIAELQFTISAKWTDEELKDQILAALAKANRMDLVVAEAAGETEAEAEPDAPPPEPEPAADDPVAKKRAEVRARLAAAMAGKKK